MCEIKENNGSNNHSLFRIDFFNKHHNILTHINIVVGNDDFVLQDDNVCARIQFNVTENDFVVNW